MLRPINKKFKEGRGGFNSGYQNVPAELAMKEFSLSSEVVEFVNKTNITGIEALIRTESVEYRYQLWYWK